MAKIRITEGSPLKIELLHGPKEEEVTELHHGQVAIERLKDFRVERLSKREVVISIGS